MRIEALNGTRTQSNGERKVHSILLRCYKAAPQFDLGCANSRGFQSHVFCLPKFCTCYIQYDDCRWTKFFYEHKFSVSVMV